MRDIEFFDPVFDPEFCRFLVEDSKKNLSSGAEFAQSNAQWNPAIVRASTPVLIRTYQPPLSNIILKELVSKGIIDDDDYVVMNYVWTKLSYIPWHNDVPYKNAVTIYLNEKWHPDWGGLFLYRDKDGAIHGVAPKFNTGLRNGLNVPHATTPVALDAEEQRFTLQLFKRPEGGKTAAARY